jgi:tRNA-specific 2-thiouridylase
MTKVVVAMSGGVDSSVAAVLLKQQGYDVVGMMLRLWSEPGREDSNRCCTPDAMALARQVAARLEIPFYAVDAREIFHSSVVKYFLDGYLNGITPNPCLVCNRIIRWKFLLEHALAMGAEYLATGHYVRMRIVREIDPGGLEVVKRQLMRAVDLHKDQSYVLHNLNQELLAKALFPVGEFTKAEIRQKAAEIRLPTASRAESQDLCFLAGEDYREFITRNIPGRIEPGDILDIHGRTIGRHKGLCFYTIGQRKSLGLASQVPLYVIAKNPNSNSLVVGEESQLGQSGLVVKEMNWINGDPGQSHFRAEVKTRYSARSSWAEITTLETGGIDVRFDEPQRDITAGQAAVVYAGDILLGGGVIL